MKAAWTAAASLFLALATPGAILAAPADEADLPKHALVRSGTRIKRWVIRSADGARWTLDREGSHGLPSLYDTRFRASCAPKVAADGRVRCLPTCSAHYCADEKCSAPLLAVRLDARNPTYRRGLGHRSDEYRPWAGISLLPRVARETCSREDSSGRFHVHRTGPAYRGRAFLRMSNGTGTPAVTGPGSLFRRLGPEIPASEFVEAIEGFEPGVALPCPDCCLHRSGSRLKLSVQRTADGAAFVYAGARPLHQSGGSSWLQDSELCTPCSTELARDRTPRCLPMTWASALHSSYARSSDPECSTPVGIRPTWAFERFALQELRADGRPPYEHACYPVLGEYEGPVFRRAREFSPATCVPMDPRHERYDERYLRLGPELPPERFVAISEVVREQSDPAGTTCAIDATRAGTRLKPIVWAGEDGLSVVVGFFDAQLGKRCIPGRAADGRLRCLPARAQAPELSFHFEHDFSDASCTRPVLPPNPTLGAMHPLREISCVGGGATCDLEHARERVRFFRAGKKQRGQLYGWKSDRCVKRVEGRSSYESPELHEYVELGAEVPPTEFVELELGVE